MIVFSKNNATLPKKQEKYENTLQKQNAKIQQKKYKGDSYSSYSEEEMWAFATHINFVLGNDPELAHLLPVDPEGINLPFLVFFFAVFLFL